MALIFLVGTVPRLIPGVIGQWTSISRHGQTFLNAVPILAAFVGLTALSVAMVSAKRRIPLRYVGEVSQEERATDWAPALPLRANMVGVIPIHLGQTVMFALATLAAASGLARIAPVLGPVSSPSSAAYWILYAGLIVFLTYVFTAVTFSSKNLVDAVKRYGYSIPEMGSDQDAAEHVDRTVERTALAGAVFLCGVAAAPHAAMKWLGVNSHLSSFLGPSLLVISAVCIDTMRQFQTRLKMHRKIVQDGGETIVEWAPVFSGETELEAEMVRGILARAGVESVVLSNRVISRMGTLAFWEASRPTLPSLTIHRRLGGGLATVQVPTNRLEEAQGVLASREIVSK